AHFTLSTGMNSWVGTPLVGGPRHVYCERTDSSGIQGFIAGHDAYVARFGIYHQRDLRLSANGDLLEGTDRFRRAGGEFRPGKGGDAVALRFHIHPDIELFRDEAGRLVLLGTETDTWTFSCSDIEPVVEESIFFAGLSGPRRSRQIVLHFNASELPEVYWRLVCTRTGSAD